MTQPDDWIGEAVGNFSQALTLYAAQLIGDVDRARDVVQETFIKLCAQPREAVAHKLKAWLYTVCRNGALDVMRKEKRMSPIEDYPEPAAPEATTIEERDDAAGLLGALERLPANQREVIRLKFLHGHSYREISSLTSLTEGNIGFLIHTGLKTLRQRLTALDLRSTL
jgi:RNA polymerase sigma factor (sigma-70 family)